MHFFSGQKLPVLLTDKPVLITFPAIYFLKIGSGKTFTMMGSAGAAPGLYLMAA